MNIQQQHLFDMWYFSDPDGKKEASQVHKETVWTQPFMKS